MKVLDFFKSKPKKSIIRTDITNDDRDMITSVFKSGHNAYEKFYGDQYVLPQNVTVNHKKARINFYKDSETLKADVGHYENESGPGNSRTSPQFHSEHDIKNKDDLKKLYNLLSK